MLVVVLICYLHPSLAVLCERPLAGGLGLFSQMTTLRRFCFSTFYISVGPAFTFS